MCTSHIKPLASWCLTCRCAEAGVHARIGRLQLFQTPQPPLSLLLRRGPRYKQTTAWSSCYKQEKGYLDLPVLPQPGLLHLASLFCAPKSNETKQNCIYKISSLWIRSEKGEFLSYLPFPLCISTYFFFFSLVENSSDQPQRQSSAHQSTKGAAGTHSWKKH